VRVDRQEPPREFGVGRRGGSMFHAGDIWLEHDEVATFRTASGTELDISRKSWGYYGTPSLNRRLREHGLRAALCVGVPRDEGDAERAYLMLVEAGEETDFQEYLDAEEMRVVAWLDTDEAVAEAARRLGDDLR
jgi:hypothetical protein